MSNLDTTIVRCADEMVPLWQIWLAHGLPGYALGAQDRDLLSGIVDTVRQAAGQAKNNMQRKHLHTILEAARNALDAIQACEN